uniref:Postreplication repair E3 ubiquitin-protein ligase RAD18 n=1 Tax=Noccaea caerulescens TaxID=107243 RepID=A0A1J3DLJ7_NOCCA
MIQMDGGDRLRVTLLDRMSTVENSRSSVTLEDVLMAETSASRPQPPSPQPSPARNRSLLDVMRRDRRRDKTTWKFLRDKLRLKRSTTTTTAWISSNLIPYLDTPISTPDNDSHNRRINRLGFLLSNSETNRSSGEAEAEREGRLLLSTVLAEEREPPRMSLMELLEDSDGPMTMYDVSKRGEEEEGTTMTTAMVTSAAESGCCCVCMIRSKGAAFIPCGHTFCRLCCRELLAQRGNCPLCNTSIIQVLDIF